MRTVSAQFLQALQAPHDLVSVFTYTPPGGSATTLRVQSGTVTVDSSQRTRRTAGLTVYGTQADYEAMTAPGTAFHIDHGIDYGANQTELVSVFHGELTRGEQRVGDGTITLQLVDHMNWIARCRLISPFAPAAATSRVQAITSIVQTAKPGTTVISTASDLGTIGSQNVWTNSGVDVISGLCKDGAMDAFFQPDGSFLICDQPTATTTPAWTIKGILESVTRQRPFDKLYNTVVVQPSATDGSQTWPQQIAQITDTANDRHPSKIGVVPYFWPSPTAASAPAALRAAQAILFRVMGSTETLSLGMLSNPALEANDVIRVIVPEVNNEPADIVQHFLDSFSLDLVSGSMTAATRSQPVSLS